MLPHIDPPWLTRQLMKATGITELKKANRLLLSLSVCLLVVAFVILTLSGEETYGPDVIAQPPIEQ